MTPLQAHNIARADSRLGAGERVLFAHIVRQGRIGPVAQLSIDLRTSAPQIQRRLSILTALGYLPEARRSNLLQGNSVVRPASTG